MTYIPKYLRRSTLMPAIYSDIIKNEVKEEIDNYVINLVKC